MKVTRFAKTVVLLNALVPLTLLGWDATQGNLGANPVNFALRTTGILSLIFLMLTLAVTPLARLARWSWLGQFRRMMGLCAFFHGLLHLLIFFWFDRAADLSSTVSEMIKRPYLMVGTLAVALMVPLAATSTDAMIRRLGGRRWKSLHRATYLVAILGVLHFYMLVKADVSRPVAFAVVLGVLLGYRLVARVLEVSRNQIDPESQASNATAVAVRPRYWTGQLRVARIVVETADVRTFRLVPLDSQVLPFDFLPGQYLNLSLVINGQRVKRCYTIASPPSRVGSCEITVKRAENGLASRYLHEQIREGDTLDLAAPAGSFHFNGQGSSEILMIAGGVGITPLMSKIRYLTDIAWPGRIRLLYSVRTLADIIFREELARLERDFPNFSVLITVSRDADETWTGERGRICTQLLAKWIPEKTTNPIHLCGPTAMMDEVVALLVLMGISTDQIKTESFVRAPILEMAQTDVSAGSSAQPHLANGSSSSRSIVFAKAGRSKVVGETETILEAAESLGVEIEYDCRAGICGSCKVSLESGNVAMDFADALTASDRARNKILACQSRCLDDVVVQA